MPYKPSRTTTDEFASRRFAKDQRRPLSNHSVSLLRLRKDMQDQAKCSKTQSTAPSVEDIPFYIPLNCRNLSLSSAIFISSPRSLSVLKGGVVGGVGSSHNIILPVSASVKASVFNEYQSKEYGRFFLAPVRLMPDF